MKSIHSLSMLIQRRRTFFIAALQIVWLCLFISISKEVKAQQTSFNIENQSSKTEFTYKWKYQDKQYLLNFAIDTAILYSMPASPASYNQKVFQENVYLKVMYEASQIDAKLANIKVKKNHNGLSFDVRSRDAKQAQLILDKLKVAHDQAQKDYWSDNFLIKYDSPAQANSIRHDHAKYRMLSSDSLAPVVKAIKNLQSNPNDAREFIDIASAWIQTIPYNRLEDRLSSNGSGFISPRDILLQNQGDCDSKSTLMAALIKAYDPNIDVQMVFLPEHALLAIEMISLADEMTLRYKGSTYILLEPTGPAQLPLGTVADTSKMALRNRQFDFTSL